MNLTSPFYVLSHLSPLSESFRTLVRVNPPQTHFLYNTDNYVFCQTEPPQPFGCGGIFQRNYSESFR